MQCVEESAIIGEFEVLIASVLWVKINSLAEFGPQIHSSNWFLNFQ